VIASILEDHILHLSESSLKLPFEVTRTTDK